MDPYFRLLLSNNQKKNLICLAHYFSFWCFLYMIIMLCTDMNSPDSNLTETECFSLDMNLKKWQIDDFAVGGFFGSDLLHPFFKKI